LRGLIRTVRIPEALEQSALVALDKLDKVGEQGVLAELAERGIERDAAARLVELVADDGPGARTEGARALDGLRERISDDQGVRAIGELAELLGLLRATPAGPRAAFVPRIVRGLGYYTGAIFEVTSAALGVSLAGGGRYDGLIGVFGRHPIPAVGGSIGLERILAVMDERAMFPKLRLGCDVLLCWIDVEPGDVLAVAHELRRQGLSVEVFPEPARLKKQLQYADSEGVRAPFAAILGEDEIRGGRITIKHLASGAQRSVPVEDAAATLADLLAAS
jgi:histidyl-tRNA synthetase